MSTSVERNADEWPRPGLYGKVLAGRVRQGSAGLGRFIWSGVELSVSGQVDLAIDSPEQD